MLRVSFYSYKGGAGRSTTSWNTIERLVHLMNPTPENPFIIMDTDIESAGSTILYNATSDFLKNSIYPSMQKRIKSKSNIEGTTKEERKKAFFNSMCPVGEEFGLKDSNKKKSILLIGVDLERNTDIIDKAGTNEDQLSNFDFIVDQCEEHGASAVFFDTPSGTQGLARMSRSASDIIVTCMRPTRQFREGTTKALEEFIKLEGSFPITYILNPTAVCVDDGQIFDGNEYPTRALEVIRQEFDKDSYNGNVKFDMLEPTPDECKLFSSSDDDDRVFGIPEIKRFKWFERALGCMPESELTSNDKMGLNRYEYLARTIMKYYNEIRG